MIKFITVILGILSMVGKFFKDHFSAKAKNRSSAIKDGKVANKKRDPSKLTAAFDKLRRNR